MSEERKLFHVEARMTLDLIVLAKDASEAHQIATENFITEIHHLADPYIDVQSCQEVTEKSDLTGLEDLDFLPYVGRRAARSAETVQEIVTRMENEP